MLMGCALAFLCGWCVVTGRIEYWGGPTEKHHFVATVDTWPFWILIAVFAAEAVVLWIFGFRAFAVWRRSRRLV